MDEKISTIKLTLEQCKEICSDFRLSTQKKACLHVRNEMCGLPSHFVCELVLHKRKVARSAELKSSALSVSRVGVLESCTRAYAFRYLHKISPEVEAPWKRMGDAFGVARARLDTGLDVDPLLLRSDLLPYEAAKVRAAIRLYRHSEWLAKKIGYLPAEVDCEVEVFFEAEGFHWLGFIDAASKDRSRLWEWKFAIGDYDMLSIARQAAFYFKGMPEAREMTIAVFRKPGQRPRKTETPEAFENRIANEMTANPDDWIKVFNFTRNQLNVDGVVRDTAESFRSQLIAARDSGYAPHYSSCHDCDYRSICEQHIGVTTDQIVQIRKKASG
jgi:hypothetical protein